jgi:hypothetical protein
MHAPTARQLRTCLHQGTHLFTVAAPTPVCRRGLHNFLAQLLGNFLAHVGGTLHIAHCPSLITPILITAGNVVGCKRVSTAGHMEFLVTIVFLFGRGHSIIEGTQGSILVPFIATRFGLLASIVCCPPHCMHISSHITSSLLACLQLVCVWTIVCADDAHGMLACLEEENKSLEAACQATKCRLVSKLEEGLAGPMAFVCVLYEVVKFYNAPPPTSDRLAAPLIPLQRDLIRSGQDILDQQRHSRMAAPPDIDAVRTPFHILASDMMESCKGHMRAFADRPTKSVRFAGMRCP